MSITLRGGESELVPLADRLRYMQVFRLGTALAAALCWFGLPDSRGLSAIQLGSVTAGYLGLSLLTGGVWRLQRRAAMTVYGAVLLADGLYLCVISYLTSGLGTPLGYLVLVHLIAVTLLASFRTGLKVALWHSLLVSVAFQLQAAHVVHLHGTALSGSGKGSSMPLFLGLIWVVTLATASLAAVNERELRRRNYDLQALARLAWQLESTSRPEAVAQALVEAISEDFSLTRMVLIAAPSGQLEVLASKGVSPASTSVNAGDDALVRQSMRERATLRVAHLDPAGDPWLTSAMPGALNIVAFPLYAEGAPVGVIVVEYGRRKGARIERRVVNILERFISQTALALNNAWLLSRVNAQAATDDLTGVANRRTFELSLELEFSRAVRSGTPLVVAMIDIDHFKAVNDNHGHWTGDLTLQRIAATLASTVRSYDLLARFGGEEFIAIMPGADLEAGMAVAERLRKAVEALSQEPRVTASLGIACFPSNVIDKESLVKAADEALYVSKGSGRNKVTASVLSAASFEALDASLGEVAVS
jgi:two-component system cell cycle response regulator